MSTSERSPGGPEDPSELLGSVIAGQFRLSTLIGDGSNATVFDAADDATGRVVTVKLVKPDAASADGFRTRFDDTMRRVAALSHPNIAALYEWGTTSIGGHEQPYVVVEQLTGGSLRDMFDRARLLSPSQALAVGLDACRALDYAHRRGFVHTELTPSKIVFGDDRRLRITDFGLAQLLNEATWRHPESVATHTAWYASPEQGRGETIDGTTDVYALCLTLHEAVTGALPFAHDSTVASLSARTGRLMPVSADLGPLASVIEHAGRPEADERSTAAVFGKELVQAASKLPRPEPLPLLSTSLFETPVDQLRTPDDPTGGVARPASDATPAVPTIRVDETPIATPVPPTPDPMNVDEADSPESAAPAVAAPAAATVGAPPDDGLVILPIDSDMDGARFDAAVAAPADAAATAPTSVVQHGAGATAATTVMPVVPAPVRRRRGFPWKTLLSLLVIAALVVLGVLATRLFETPVYTVPDLVEMPEAEARNVVAANQWVISVERQRSDQVPVVDQVVRTTPQAGVELAEGEPFLIVVSDGPTLRELPESTGLPLADAQTRLVERQIDVLTPIEQFDEDIPPDTVISWGVPGDATITAGSMVEPGTPVQLVISIGPAPREIPDVVGQPVGAAREQLTALGLTLSELPQEFSDDVPLGSVISQSTAPGTEVERGTDMSVTVSKGPDIVPFPDLSGAATYEEAAQILTDAGFVPQLTFGDAQGAVESVLIDGAEPALGETFRRGTQVDIRAL